MASFERKKKVVVSLSSALRQSRIIRFIIYTEKTISKYIAQNSLDDIHRFISYEAFMKLPLGKFHFTNSYSRKVSHFYYTMKEREDKKIKHR